MASSFAPTAGSFDYIFKVLLIGDAGVGKSSILLRFTDDSFEEQMASTIGVDFRVKTVTLGGKTAKLTIWDTAGQERFRTLTSSYYRGCHGVILVFDVNDRDSFTHLQQWLEELDLYSTTQHSVKLLVGNKIDVRDRQVTVEEAEAFARRQAMMYIETSAKTREGIRQAFEEVVQKILDSPALLQEASGGSNLGGMRVGLEQRNDEAVAIAEDTAEVVRCRRPLRCRRRSLFYACQALAKPRRSGEQDDAGVPTFGSRGGGLVGPS
eukprot:CAMPEP_0115863246 /NCGR_PEP_ID=MMETSP0287-20121206/18593_1 /TAXON_ID=412157 /ORGANISM="Chrysochromulina rotalis, Strain UIO044" /LENGTH=265 /DNA_ID=CAMNT_0003317693 /DNA_START=97 /DNA_END=892 /DNA_ORIENTATION=-